MQYIHGEDRTIDYSAEYLGYRRYVSRSSTKRYNKIDSNKELKEICDSVFEVIAEGIVNSPGGVMIKKFGYLYVKKIPYKKYNRSRTNAYDWYMPAFIPVRTFTRYYFHSIDGWFHLDIIRSINSKIKRENFKYKNYSFSLNGFLFKKRKVKSKFN